uniref:Uncharacterized protein n=1 Tax=uncultured marine virus TaxID=186617 RepID=A0A0F7L4V1_9VIRU|nr:hypothetical protein [uncultured marine virus]
MQKLVYVSQTKNLVKVGVWEPLLKWVAPRSGVYPLLVQGQTFVDLSLIGVMSLIPSASSIVKPA